MAIVQAWHRERPAPPGDTPVNAAVDAADGSRWSDLLAVLCDPAYPARLLAPTRTPNQARPLGDGAPDALTLEAARLGGGLAVVAVIRPELVALDLDGCADLVRPDLLHAAALVGGALVYLAASGSVDSEHVVFACPSTAARLELLEAVGRIRAHRGLDAGQVDHRHGIGGALRLPGSASLKGGGPVVPVDEDGAELCAASATRRALEALEAVGGPLGSAGGVQSASVAHRPGTVALGVVGLEDGGPVVRAWRRRAPLDSDQRAALEAVPRPGQDRSALARRALWALWCHGVRSVPEALELLAGCPSWAAKYGQRRDGGAAVARAALERWAAYRGPVSDEDGALCRAWLEVAARWTSHDEAAALVAVISHRFADGRGVEGRPVAVRDLALWCGWSTRTAHRWLRALVDRGALVLARSHDDGPASEAALYSLGGVEDLPHDADTPLVGALQPSAVLAPVWSMLGQGSRAVWSMLTAEGQAPAVLAAGAGLVVGRSGRSGVLLLLERLESVGLAVRSGSAWSVGAADLAVAGRSAGAGDHLEVVARLVAAERAIWHADCAADRVAAGVALEGLQSAAGVGGSGGADGRVVAGAVRPTGGLGVPGRCEGMVSGAPAATGGTGGPVVPAAAVVRARWASGRVLEPG